MEKYAITITRSERKPWSVLDNTTVLSLIEKVGDGPNGLRVGLWQYGNKVAYCSGGGYDMRGTNLASYLSTLPNAQEVMRIAHENKVYGVHFSTDKNRYWANGACGTVEDIFGVSVSSMKA